MRTDGGKVGWVNRQQLETTLTAAGGRKSFRDILLDDYLSRKVQLGAAWGHFKSEPMLKLWTSYRLSETLSVEGTIGQVQGVFSGTDFWHLNLLAEPWSDRRFSPFFGIGVGKFRNFPNQSLVGATTTDAKLANAGIGVRYHLTDRFVMRADYSLYTAFVSDTRTTEYRAFTSGFVLLLRPDPCITGTHEQQCIRILSWPRDLAGFGVTASPPIRRRPTTRSSCRRSTAATSTCRAFRRTTSRSASSAAPTRRRTSAPAPSAACASAITSPRTSSSKACSRRPRSATNRSARCCPAACSRRRPRSSATTTSRPATTCCPARCSSAASAPSRRSST